MCEELELCEIVVMVELKVTTECYTLVQVYAPTDDSKSEAKDQFYAKMQRVLENIVMDNLNAGVGENTHVWGSVLGCHGEDVRNESGERLLRFCTVNELMVTNTWYSHKNIHKYTWMCPEEPVRLLPVEKRSQS